jgi:hypothetical protein
MLSKSASSYLSIRLLEPTIYVEPTSTTTNSAVRGTLNLNLPKTTTIKSISIRFSGKMETSNNVNSIENSANKYLAREHLVLYPTTEQQKNRPLIMNSGLTQYGFEMQVPSGLPESIDCSEVKVKYQVTAVMEYYSTNSKKLSLWQRTPIKKQVTAQDIRIVRLPHSDILMGDTMSDPIDSHTRKSPWLDYQIIVNKKAVSLGSKLPITFKFTPIIEGGVSINRVSVQMLEKRCLYHGEETKTSYAVHSILPATRNKTPSSVLTEPWEGTIDYSLPREESNNKTLVHSTQEYLDFNVNHTLLISIALSIPDTVNHLITKRVHKMVTFQAQIDLLSESIGELDSLKLPTYDSPPPFDNTEYVFGECDRKFADPPAYSDIIATTTTAAAGHQQH